MSGTLGVVRTEFTFTGVAGHAGATPMDGRRDPVLAAARFLLAARDAGRQHGALITAGRLIARPGIGTAVAQTCEVLVDLRAAAEAELERARRDVLTASERAAIAEDCNVAWREVWGMPPVRFDAAMVQHLSDAAAFVGRTADAMLSGPLHDAAELQRAGIPSAMLFVQSRAGLSHHPDEDTSDTHLIAAVRALASGVNRILAAPWSAHETTAHYRRRLEEQAPGS